VAWSENADEAEYQGEFITRQFYATNGVVWVKDTICLSTNIEVTLVPEVKKLIHAKIEGRTNVVSLLNALVGGECLQLSQWSSDVIGGFVRVELVSKLHGERGKFLPVHLVATYARYSRMVTIAGELVEPYVLIGADSEGAVLWMPEWQGTTNVVGDIATILTIRSIQNNQPDRRAKPDGLVIRAVIIHGSERNIIFEDHPDRPVSGMPSERFIKAIQSFRPISGNDWNSLFTDFKPGKSGFYLLDTIGFTNIPPTNLQR
jgi:hypothetical protein